MKILVNIHIPAIDKKYDIFIPDFLRIRNITSLLSTAIEELSDHLYVPSGHECLCYLEKNILLRQNATLASYGIQNGDHLILM